MPNNIAFLTKKVTNYVTFYGHVMIKVMLMFFGLKFANNKRRTRQRNVMLNFSYEGNKNKRVAC